MGSWDTALLAPAGNGNVNFVLSQPGERERRQRMAGCVLGLSTTSWKLLHGLGVRHSQAQKGPAIEGTSPQGSDGMNPCCGGR